MRIAGTSYTESLVNQLNLLSTRQYQLQNQAATGQKISAPSDNPAAMAQALNLQADNSTVTQYAQNIATLQTRATIAGNALSSMQTIEERANEIATQADGTATPAQLQAYATEVTQLIKQAAQVMNTKDGSQFVFGGTASDAAPFAVNADTNGNVTAVTYSGNTSVNQSEVSTNVTMTVDAPGENNTGSGPRGVVSDSRYGADFFNHLISLQNNLLSGNTGAIASTDLPNLTHDSDNIIYQVAANGAAQSRLAAAASLVSTQQSGLQTSLSNTAGADLTQTLTQLSEAQNAYQAALATSSRVMQMQQYILSMLP